MKRIISIILSVIMLCSLAPFGAGAEDAVSVTLSGITDGQTVGYGTEIKVTAAASAQAAVLTLYVDNEAYSSAENVTSKEFVLTDISAGRHTLKATADAAESSEIEFYYISVTEETVSFENFENESTRGADWTMVGQTDKAAYRDENGDCVYVTIHTNGTTGEKPYLEAKSDLISKLPSSGFTFEFDTKQSMNHATNNSVQGKFFVYLGSSKTINYSGGIARHNYRPSLTVGDSGPYFNMTGGTWYHVKMVFDLLEGTMNYYYAEGKGNTSNMTHLGSKTLTSKDAVTRIKWEFDGYGTVKSELMVDNISINQTKYSAYLAEPSYYIDSTEYAAADIPANPNKVLIPFSTDMDSSTLTSDAVSVKCGDDEVAISEVQYVSDKKALLVTFAESLSSNKAYSLAIDKSVKTAQGVTQPTDLGFKFKTGYNDFDMISCIAKKGGSAIDAADIKAGDEITFEYTLQNKTGIEQTGTLIFAAYENDALAYLDIQDISVSTVETDNRKTFVSTASYAASASPDSIEIYLWKNMTERTSRIKAYKMK